MTTTRPSLEVGTPVDIATDCPTCHAPTLYAYPLHVLTDAGVRTIGALFRCLWCDG